MKIEALWLSQQGTRTKDNRDCAGIGTGPGEFLGVVVDGSTTGSTNGEYAQAIVEMLVDWFVESVDAWSADLVLKALRQIHQTLRERFRSGSASILLFQVAEEGSFTVLHSGDCALGEVDRHVTWQSTPHTFANALAKMPLKEIAKSPIRHLLTRSFRAKEYMSPDVLTREKISGSFLLATDGFWPELSEEQQIAFVAGDQSVDADRDDRSVLRLRLSLREPFSISLSDRSSINLYSRL